MASTDDLRMPRSLNVNCQGKQSTNYKAIKDQNVPAIEIRNTSTLATIIIEFFSYNFLPVNRTIKRAAGLSHAAKQSFMRITAVSTYSWLKLTFS